MSDNKLPKIPSFEELGISSDELEELERELAGEARPADREAAAPAGGAGAGASAGTESAAAEGRADAGARPPKEKAAGARPPKEKAAGRIPRGWRAWRGPLTIAFLAFAAWFSAPSRSLPSPAEMSAPESAFSSARAMEHLQQIARSPRPPGSPGHLRAREYLLARLREMGHESTVQTSTAAISQAGFARVATVNNVLARVPGSQPGGGAVLVTAHYDSREISVGASDDGVGVVAILEALRALGTGPALRNDVIVFFSDAEELGLLGARAFVDEHPWLGDVAMVLSFDMRGGGGPALMFETGNYNGWVIDELREAAPRVQANSIIYEIYRLMPNNTDFTPFKEVGKQGLNFASLAKPSVYHQAYDTPALVSAATLQDHGEHALALLRHFGNADLTSVHEPNVSYMTVPFLGVVVYGRMWVWLLGLATLGLWLLALVAGKKRGSRARGVLAGFGASVVYLGAIGAAAGFYYGWLRRFHPEAGSLMASSFHGEGMYVLAIVCMAFALASLMFVVLRRWFTLPELAAGGTLLPVLLAAAMTAVAPFGAASFQWPALAGCLAALAVAGLQDTARAGMVRWLAVLLFAVPVVVVLAPLTLNIWLTLGLMLAPAVAILAGLAFLMVFPVLDIALEPNRWWIPVAGLLAAVAFTGAGIAMAEPTVGRPAPSTLVYALDTETELAYWGTDPEQGGEDPGTAWAEGSAGAFAEPGAGPGLERFSPREIRYATAPATVVEVSPLQVTLVSELETGEEVGEDVDGETGEEDGEGKQLPAGRQGAGPEAIRVTVRSGINAEMLLFRFEDKGPQLVAVDDRNLGSGERMLQVEHWGHGPEGVTLEFAPGLERVLRFEVVEHLLRPKEILGPSRFTRPAELAPNVRMSSDRAMILTPVIVDLETGLLRVGAPVARAEEEDARDGGSASDASTDANEEAVLSDTATAKAPEIEGGSAADTTTTAQPDTSATYSNPWPGD